VINQNKKGEILKQKH